MMEFHQDFEPGDLGKVAPERVGHDGPKPKEIDLTLVYRAARISCTVDEIATLCGVSRATFFSRMQAWPIIGETIESGALAGKASLRRKQFQLALDGNATMCIWMGKQLLGQRDTQQLQQLDAAGRPADPVIPVLRVTVTRTPKGDD